MRSKTELSDMFFSELKRYNLTNFRALAKADLLDADPALYKAFSSVVTRFFIFCEKHPELNSIDRNVLFFQLKIDMIARYFSEYPAASMDDLRPFQRELQHYLKVQKEDEANAEMPATV